MGLTAEQAEEIERQRVAAEAGDPSEALIPLLHGGGAGVAPGSNSGADPASPWSGLAGSVSVAVGEQLERDVLLHDRLAGEDQLSMHVKKETMKLGNSAEVQLGKAAASQSLSSQEEGVTKSGDISTEVKFKSGADERASAAKETPDGISSGAQLNPASVSEPPPPNHGNVHDGNVHVVFSTDCSAYQDWQSEVLWYSALMVQHRGLITRIASGCSEEDAARVRRSVEVKQQAYLPFARVHFTPKFSKDKKTGKEYHFYNKVIWSLHIGTLLPQSCTAQPLSVSPQHHTAPPFSTTICSTTPTLSAARHPALVDPRSRCEADRYGHRSDRS